TLAGEELEERLLVVGVEFDAESFANLAVGDDLLVDLRDGHRSRGIESLAPGECVGEELEELVGGRLHGIPRQYRGSGSGSTQRDYGAGGSVAACLSTSARSSSMGSEMAASSSSRSFHAFISGWSTGQRCTV